MATRFIDKEHGIDSTTAIADDATGRNKVRNLVDAVGLVFDRVANVFKFNKAGTITEIVDTTATQTLTNKTLTAPTLTSAVISQPQTVYAADGAIAVATHTAMLTKAGVNAMTLAAPAVADNGKRVTIISATNNAHTVTVPTDKGHDGTTGVNELFTFAAFAGASMVLEAYAEAWYVVSLNAVTPTSTA